jgi:Na+/proline symporter
MGTILGSAVLPIALAVTWSKANRLGCIIGALIGFAAGIAAWLIATSVLNHGVINVDVSITFPQITSFLRFCRQPEGTTRCSQATWHLF